MVSLGYEFVNGNAEYIYIYGSMESGSTSFNAFYKIGGEIKTTNKVTDDRDFIIRFLDAGMEDLSALRELYEKYSQRCPTELRLTYNVQTSEFDIEYKYEPVFTEENEWIAYNAIMAWVEEEKRKLR